MTARQLAAERLTVYATLLDHFHLTLDQISNLTDLQICDYYFHKRNAQTGQLEKKAYVPVEESLASELAQLDILAGTYRLKPENVKILRQRIRAKWAEKDR